MLKGYIGNVGTKISRKDRPKYVIIFVVLIVVLWVLSGTLIKNEQPLKTEFQDSSNTVPKVKILDSTAKEIQKTITIFGTTESSKKVVLKPETYGIVNEIIASEGDLIETQQPILNIGIDDREAKLSEAQASLEQRNIEYTAAKSLSKSGYNPETKKAEAFALLKKAESELLTIKLDIDKTTIKAPFAGILDSILVEEGDYVKIGETSLATILAIDPIIVTGYVPERIINYVEVGNESKVKIVTGEEELGYVSFISKVSDPLTRTFRVEVEVANSNMRIFEGLTSEIEISLGKVKAHLVPPSIFSLSEKGDIGVKTLGQNNKVEFFVVEVIEDTREGIWIAGLPEKAKIITLGQAFLKEGDIAEPIK